MMPEWRTFIFGGVVTPIPPLRRDEAPTASRLLHALRDQVRAVRRRAAAGEEHVDRALLDAVLSFTGRRSASRPTSTARRSTAWKLPSTNCKASSRLSSGCGTDDCGRTSATSRPSTMPSLP
jgi:hypothetical protein